METKMQNNSTNPFTIIQDYFLIHWVNTIGLGPAMLYIQLASYCHKGKDTAWPSIKTLNKRLGTTTKTLIKYRDTLVEYGLIKKIVKQKFLSGGYDHNLYQIVLLDKDKIHLPPGEKLPEEDQKVISGIAESSEQNMHSNNSSQKDTDKITPSEQTKECIKEELASFRIDEKTINKIIDRYPLDIIEEKLELLQTKRNLINPAGWLISALKENYASIELFNQEDVEEKELEKINMIQKSVNDANVHKINTAKKEENIASREVALKWLNTIRKEILK